MGDLFVVLRLCVRENVPILDSMVLFSFIYSIFIFRLVIESLWEFYLCNKMNLKS